MGVLAPKQGPGKASRQTLRPVLDHHRNGCPGAWQRAGHRYRLRAVIDTLISCSPARSVQVPRRFVNLSKEKP